MTHTLLETEQDMRKLFDEHKSSSYDQIPWIVSKVVRITMAQYHLIEVLSEEEYERCLAAASRIAQGETVASVFGVLEFYGRFFEVNLDVFFPRLSTHALIDSIVGAFKKEEKTIIQQDKKGNAISENKVQDNKLRVLDLCTGTGCIAITLSLLLPAETVGVDISVPAISLANRNKLRLNAPLCEFAIMDVLKPWDTLQGKFDIVVSNPPYWNMEQLLSKSGAVKSNPLSAFLGGNSGMEFHEAIIANAPQVLAPKGKLFLEMEENQESHLRIMLEKNYEDIIVAKDYAGKKRVIYATMK